MKKRRLDATAEQATGHVDLGQHMTPPAIARQMTQFIRRPPTTWKVLDPACGDGNLLLAVIDRMQEAGLTDVVDRVAGIDIDEAMVRVARRRIAERLHCPSEAVCVTRQDFLRPGKPDLFHPSAITPAAFNTIISNPPYGQNREYRFFTLCAERFPAGTELVFLLPLAFLDRVQGVESFPLPGRPMGVTTGHAIVYHSAGKPFEIRGVKEKQSNSSQFLVLTGVKLYEPGGGSPPQTREVVRTKPFSDTTPKPGWLPCLRTGDIHAYRYELGRLYVHHGAHLAHPKELARFCGPRLFLRRVPLWENRRLGAVYLDETALCAGDVLVVRHGGDDPELLKGLCVFLNSPEAAERMLQRRPSLRYRDSYPKFSAKDVHALLEAGAPPPETLRELARQYPQGAAGSSGPRRQPGVLIEQEFPVGPISASCAREKSTRQGHISTLQMWWARRPLAVCRAAIFAALVPWPGAEEPGSPFLAALEELLPGKGTAAQRLGGLTARLAEWATCEDEDTLAVARRLIAAARPGGVKVADTFAGGGSFPLEALRLGLDAFAGDLNPVAATALKVSLELLPGAPVSLLNRFKEAAEDLCAKARRFSSALYGHTADRTVLACFWCRTYECPECKIEVPLLKNRLLSSGDTPVTVDLVLDVSRSRVRFTVCERPSPRSLKDASSGTVGARGACCPNCAHRVPTSFLQQCSRDGKMGERLYAKRVASPSGAARYEVCDEGDELLAATCRLRSVPGRLQRTVPAEPFDVNGIRHTWAMQYGIRTTAHLFNRRQGVALLEVFHEVEKILAEIRSSGLPDREQQALSVLLALTFNRLVMYNSRHSWWQPKGEFPANMFVRQAIPMVWNYVEIPVDSPAAGGLPSAAKWIALVAEHCRRLPGPATVAAGDAARSPLPDASVDLVTLDPPYYDSVVYAYLSDVFYVWMKPLLAGLLPHFFTGPVTPKAEEAIVDRPHKLATAPKGDRHFRAKMVQAFREARRVLKPAGRLLLMFGHKRVKAWDAILGPLFDAGFIPVASWPVHTERKVKLRHGRIAALSSSCLLVCTPSELKAAGTLGWPEFRQELREVLQPCIRECKNNHLYGSDSLTATIAPSVTALKRYERVTDGDVVVTLDLLLKRLPGIMAQTEMATLLRHRCLSGYARSRQWLAKLAADTGPDQDRGAGEGAVVSHLRTGDGLMRAAGRYSDLLLAGETAKADSLWESLGAADRTALRVFFEVLSLSSALDSAFRQRADTSLGRISMRLRQNGAAPHHGT
jgi:adenine-specific DNA methylase/predicted RNA methylase